MWKFNDDADRRNHWKTLFADKDFMEGFAAKFRPLVMTQEVKLLLPTPWGAASVICSRAKDRDQCNAPPFLE
jgi:NIPSNAP